MSTTPASPATSPPVDADEVRHQLFGKHVCPFCGVMRTDPAQPCARCTLDDNAATRGATRVRIGPWFVLQARNPSAPGMRLATLQSLIRKGHVTPRSVVRGPTTEQLWTFAANTRGLSREFGLCYLCGENIAADDEKCAHCGKSQALPADVDALLETPSAPQTPNVEKAPAVPQRPAPAPVPTPVPTVLSEPIIRGDLLSDALPPMADSGMDGGTSLDLQADALFPLADTRVRQVPPPQTRPLVQRSPTPAGHDAILSASELAAAFQLDFKGPGTGRNGGQRARPVRTLAALLLIAVVAGAIVLALRPDWRRTSTAWVIELGGRIAASLEQPAKPATPAQPTPPKPAVATNPEPAEPPTPATAATAAQVPFLAPPPVAARPEPTPEPKPEPVARPVTPPVVRPPEPPAEEMSIERATVVASDLRLKAIDAQARGNWPAALQFYEQIQRLPRDAWPADLPLRLDVARRRVERP